MDENFDSRYLTKYRNDELENKLKELVINRNNISSYFFGEPDDFENDIDFERDVPNNFNEPQELSDLRKYEIDIRRIILELDKRKRKSIESNLSIKDISIKSMQDDLLDYETYSKKISDVIKKIDKPSGIHVGIFGDWGTGKSFLLDLIEKNFLTQPDKKYPVIRINASSGGEREEIWYSLLSRVADFYAPRYSFCKTVKYIVKSIGRKGGWIKFVLFLLSLLLFFIVLFIIIKTEAVWSKILSFVSSFISISVSGVISLSTFSSLISTLKEINFVDKNFFTKFSYPNYKDLLGEKEKIKNELETFVELILKEKKSEKLIIAIDELDRCDRDKLVNFFEAIETFINLEKVIFIFSLNPRILSEKDDKDNRILDLAYLEKYFNISFTLPTNIDYKSFIKSKCSQWGDDEVIASMIELINQINQFERVTPRKINSILNFISFYRQDYRQLTLKEFSNLVILLTSLKCDVIDFFEKIDIEKFSRENLFGTILSEKCVISSKNSSIEAYKIRVINDFMRKNPELSPNKVLDCSKTILKLLPQS